MRILIVEDEKEIADGIRSILEKNGYEADVVNDGHTGTDFILSNVYDLILLDIMLPGISGIEVLKNIRNAGIHTPVIILTAMSQTNDKVSGLDSGADDYMVKPFNASELLARIRARTRKDVTERWNIVRAYDIWLEKDTFILHGPEKSVRLARKEYQLMEYLMVNKGRILTRDLLILKIWGMENEPDYNHLDVYISFLRKKIRFIDADSAIVTKKGVGYSLEQQEDR